MTKCMIGSVLLALMSAVPVLAADTASGAVTIQKMPTIAVTKAVAYRIREARNARNVATEILLTDVAVDRAPMLAALEPHMEAINLEAIKDRNYVILNVDAAGNVSMNATISRTMSQFINDTSDGLKITWTTRSATRLEGRLFTEKPLDGMDTTYTVDLRFGVDIPPAPAGQALPVGGGDPGKVLTSFITAAQRKNWPAIKATLSPAAVEDFERSYNTPAENAAGVAQLAELWFPKDKLTITGGQLRGEKAVLEVEGETFPGMNSMTFVEMVKTGTAWKFERAIRFGIVPTK